MSTNSTKDTTLPTKPPFLQHPLSPFTPPPASQCSICTPPPTPHTAIATLPLTEIRKSFHEFSTRQRGAATDADIIRAWTDGMRSKSIVQGNMPHDQLRRVLAQTRDLDRRTCAELLVEIASMRDVFDMYRDRYVSAMTRYVTARMQVLVPRVQKVVKFHRGIARRNGGQEDYTLGQAEVLVEEVERGVERGMDCWGWEMVVRKVEVCEGIVGVWEGPVGRL